MRYCKKCGSELTGMKKYCVICGASQDESKKEKEPAAAKQLKGKGAESGRCVRCGNESDKTCFFCKEFVCRDHYTRMQANVNTYVTMQDYLTQQETAKINEGWRGFMIYACPKCLRLKVGKKLTDEEIVDINTVDECSWYKLESQAL